MLATGTILQGRYRVVAPLGQGGMGAVYRVWDMRLNAPVALKELTPQPGLDAATLAQLRHQFEQEASVLANLSHPFLVDVTDFFEEGGNDYLVMKFVEGESLADCITREGALPEDRVLAWADQLLDALDYCHNQGVIHRDIKPQNVIIRADGRAVLVDFGLVKLWDPDDPHTRTAMRGMGTPEYAPPEQYSTQAGHTDPRSDIYGLGATLYHALTGQAPVSAGDRMAALSPFPEVRDLNPRVSAQVGAAVSRAMELPVPGRFQGAVEMRAALKGASRVPTDEIRVAQSGATLRATARAATPVPRQPTREMPISQPVAPRRRTVPVWVWVVLGGVGFAVVLLLCGGLALGIYGVGPAAASPTVPVVASTGTPPMATARPLSHTAMPTQAGPFLGDTWPRSADGMVMVFVPAGESPMGSTEGESDERPVHVVALDGFWIDRTEVTNDQYGRCVAAGACEPPEDSGSYSRESYYGDVHYQDYPVIHVNWHQARAYCEWVGARLPTEAEWEYAARGPQGWRFPWGDGADGGRLNYCDASCQFGHADGAYDDGHADTAPVGTYPAGASWCGALDLAGNVWEWTADWSGEYPSGWHENPVGPSSGTYRVMRGGCLNSSWDHVRAANREPAHPGSHGYSAGFRCVVSPGE
jgi:serine/threonine-protein kinase